MNILRNIGPAFIIGVLFSCTEIPVEISDPVIPDSDRIVLIEELTGVSCVNCPKGSASLDNILAKFSGKVVAVGLHGGLLTEPIKNKSKYDFRTQQAVDLTKFFNPIGKPAASVNRVPYDDFSFTNLIPDLWEADVLKELNKPHVMNLLLDVKYDQADRRIEIEVAGIPLENLAGNYNISIYLTESEIVDAQASGNVFIDNYVHKHVLREMLTNFDGDNFGNDLKKDAIIRKNYAYTLPTQPEGLWKPEHMEVVVMVNHNNATDKSVLQANAVHLME